MMKKPHVIVLDGNDSTGKTTLQSLLKNSLEERGLRVHCLHFPSEELMESEVTKKMIAGDREARSRFVTRVVLEAQAKIMFVPDNTDIVLVDRLMISTLLYQGTDDLKRQDEKLELTEQIVGQYGLMVHCLERPFFDYYVFSTPVRVLQEERVVESENRRAYDDKKEELRVKLRKIVDMLKAGDYDTLSEKVFTDKMTSPFSSDVFRLTDMDTPDVVLFHSRDKKFTPEQMDEIQRKRCMRILEQVMSKFS